MSDSINGNSANSRAEKLKYLELDENTTIDSLNDELLNHIYSKVIKEKETEKVKENKVPSNVRIKKPKGEKLDKSDKKYQLTLKFLNSLLKAVGKEEIDDITNFKEVKKDELLTDGCQKVLDKHINEICKIFGKSQIYYRDRNSVEHYIISLIKYMVSIIGYQFEFKIKSENSTLENNTYKIKKILLYSIS